MLDSRHLGQVFTPPDVVEFMLGLCRNNGRFLEPSAGDGAFHSRLTLSGMNTVGIELDPRVISPGAILTDFFSYPTSEQFDTVVGNPPYVRFQNIRASTRALLPMDLFDTRANLFLFFIEKSVRHLRPGGELVFIVPRELTKLTAARKLNAWLFQQGSMTHFIETGDQRIFRNASPNCVIFRFLKGCFDRRMADGRTFHEKDGQLLFLRNPYHLSVADLFDVRVGAASGADHLFTSTEGNTDFVFSKTLATGQTRRMIYRQEHPALLPSKPALMARKIARFDESNWWHWGRNLPTNTGPRIYVNGRTRNRKPFFMHEATAFDGSILALFPKPGLQSGKLSRAVDMLNNEVDWNELGFDCDGRLLFIQRSLQNAPLPERFRSLLE